MEFDPASKTNWLYTGNDYREFLQDNNIEGPGGDSYRGRVAEMGLGKYTRSRNYSIPKTGCYKEGFEKFFDGFYAHGAVEAIQKGDKNKLLILSGKKCVCMKNPVIFLYI